MRDHLHCRTKVITTALSWIATFNAVAACGVVHVALNLLLYERAARRPAFEPLLVARRSLGAVAAMAAYFIFLRPDAALAETSAWMRLAADIGAGAGVYAAALMALWRLEGLPDGVERRIAGMIGAAAGRFRGA